MEQVEFQKLIDRLETEETDVRLVEISDEEMKGLTPQQANELVARYGSNTLMMLPEREQRFFVWLKERDEEVWADLWGAEEEPYKVSLAFLNDLLPNKRGFLISHLNNEQNPFFFSAQNITADDGQVAVDAALDVVKANGQLTMDQAFMIEVWRAPIDIWRFAYIYKIPLEEVKKMVGWLVSEGMLVVTAPEEEETDDDILGDTPGLADFFGDDEE